MGKFFSPHVDDLQEAMDNADLMALSKIPSSNSMKHKQRPSRGSIKHSEDLSLESLSRDDVERTPQDTVKKVKQTGSSFQKQYTDHFEYDCQ